MNDINVLKSFKLLKETLLLLIKYKKIYLFILLFLSICSGVLPYVSLITSQNIMNYLQTMNGNFNSLLLLVIIYFTVIVTQMVIGSLYSYLLKKYNDYIFKELNILFLEKCSYLSYQDYENPRTYDILTRAEQQIGVRPISIINTFLNIISSFISFMSSLIILASWHLWSLIGFLILPILSYKYFVKINQKEFNTITNRTIKERQSWYFTYLMIKDYYIKEIKSLDLYQYFLNRYSKIKNEIYKEDIIINKRKSLFSFFYQLSNTIFSLVVVIVAMMEAFSGMILLGNFMTYISTSSKVESAITSITSSLFSIYTDLMYCQYLVTFFDLVNEREKNVKPGKKDIHDINTIELRNVSYRYPNSKNYALENISLKFEKGRKYVLVGENGSGKTTLIKILNGLYLDYEGDILVNGINLKNIDQSKYKKLISVIFQDYNNYELTARENIGLGDVSKIEDFNAVYEAATIGGSKDFIESLPNQFDQQLGNWFEGGIQLSGGQWQKIAISRALIKKAEVSFFDEPTASLDPSSEYMFFNNLTKYSNNKITVFVTHRFTNARIADKVFVFKNGQIVETGNHEELLNKNGLYCSLYNLQIGKNK